MDSLIAKLETGPGSRYLSDLCLKAVGWLCAPIKATTESLWRSPDGAMHGIDRPDPSRNAQDAIDHLVPEGRRFKVGRDDDGGGYASVGGPRIIEAATPALALCIASLRAHAAVKETICADTE